MSVHHVRFVGGPMDGSREDVDELVPVRTLWRNKSPQYSCATDISEDVRVSAIHYRLERIHFGSPDETEFFYVLDEMKTRDAFRWMLLHWAPPRDPGES